jgi:hypothetical protein
MKYTSGGLTTDFDSKQAASKTVDDFVAHEKHLGFSDDQLKEVHALCVREQKPQAKVKEEDKTN